ncbi:MAG: DeoR/GlpR transcriptional regulator, partial [Lachnospiraceae bacterium]|nr:DeoR/GlpR transcriptional regulator [Lachnospiraceae bacterium]
MLTENRLSRIEAIVNSAGSVSTVDLMEALDASESTIRRDLSALSSQGRLVRVRGGAMAIGNAYGTRDDDVDTRKTLHQAEKLMIGEYAASLIGDEDFVFIDAGTTTEAMIP